MLNKFILSISLGCSSGGSVSRTQALKSVSVKLVIEKSGSGRGTVISNPSGIECGDA